MYRRFATAGTLLLVTALATGIAAHARQSSAPEGVRTPPTQEERRKARFEERGPRDAAARQAEEALRAHQAAQLLTPAPVDVQRYTIDLKVIPATTRLEGTVRIQAQVLTPGLTTLDVGLYDNMAITSILRGATALAYTRASNIVHITLDRAYASGEMVDITITYAGVPSSGGFGAFTFRTHGSPAQPIISSLSEDIYAPLWWSCIDRPDDKAIVDMNLNVPAALTGVSNGLLVATLNNPDGTKTFQWRSAYPISTYLVSVAISNYATFSTTYSPVTGGAPMLVQHWVYPEHLAAAQTDFSVTVPQLTFFSGLFGEYPFVNEKYGHAIFPFGGGMEHQTGTSYGASLIKGTHQYDWIVAHEMAHQWWGDYVTLGNWKETWLNEGFASYAEALWWEHINGAAGLRAYMAGFDSRPFCGTLADPTGCDNFGHTVYDKGAWVLHMLRRIVGDNAFFLGLRNYGFDHQYGNVTSADLKAEMESVSGRSLSAFFDRWVYQAGEPSYRWGWTAASTPAGWVTHVRIEQIQPGAVFEMPLDLRVVTGAGSATITVEDTSAAQDFALPPVASQPTSVQLDPDYWVLMTASTMTLTDTDLDGVPDTADDCPQDPNPAQTDLDSDGLGDVCDGDIDGDGRPNGTDCAPADPSAQDPPAEATGLDVAGGGAGPSMLTWDPDPAQGAGVVFDLLRGVAGSLRADGGIAGASCRALGLTQPAFTETAVPAANEAFYYLVRKHNACGAGTVGPDSSGAPRTPLGCP